MSIVRINSLGITDGTIVNGDINASAGITLAKLSGVNDAKAWVNFNGTGTVAIREDFNVSSITDNGTGDYTVNFTTAMPDVNYCVTGTGQYDQTGNAANGNAFINTYRSTGAVATGSCRIGVTSSATVFDAISVYVAIFR